FRYGPGLVEDHRIQTVRALERLCVADQDAGPGRGAGAVSAVGVASPSEQGQAMTITETAAMTPALKFPATSPHPRNAASATAPPPGTKPAATRSTRRCTGAFFALRTLNQRDRRAWPVGQMRHDSALAQNADARAERPASMVTTEPLV